MRYAEPCDKKTRTAEQVLESFMQRVARARRLGGLDLTVTVEDLETLLAFIEELGNPTRYP